ncbi:MAG: SynChlorMet cassette radical SAM/SPASM protein ScmF [Lentisphaerae bacterium]|nr:SynChlorMet cassette radical SAM/SPASM protein ScmF [Lentisphaerota bacterium]
MSDAVEDGSVPPLGTIYCYLTEGCNLACRHCWLAPKFDADGSGHAVLPVDVFEGVVREAKPLGLSSVKFTGGEPLLHPRFGDLVEIASKAGVSVQVETNGLLCTPETARLIAGAPRPFVSVSIDGADAATHEWLRGIAGSFDKACRAVRNLSEAGLAPQVVMTLVRENMGQIEAVVRMAERLGAGSVRFNMVEPTARGADLGRANALPGVEELVAAGRIVDSDLAARTRMSLHFDIPQAFRPLGRIARSDESCGILTILGLLSTGHYALCGIGMQVKELVFGMAGKDNLSGIWRGSRVLGEIRAGLPQRLQGVCGRCLMNSRCLGACLAQNYYRLGSMWGPYWFCEQAEEQGLFPSTRVGGTV